MWAKSCTGPTFCPYRLISCLQLAHNTPPPPVVLYLPLWNVPLAYIYMNSGGEAKAEAAHIEKPGVRTELPQQADVTAPGPGGQQ